MRRGCHSTHDLRDVGYHGSGTWECRFCDIGEHDEAASNPCPKRAEVLRKEAIKKAQEEWYEYRRMVIAKQRFEELHQRYKDGPPEGAVL